jgi:hypothetical protein
MRPSGLPSTPSEPHGLKMSFQDAMANLINAFAHPRPAVHPPELEAQSGAQANAGAAIPTTAAHSGPYDIADALADVARAIAPRTAATPKEAGTGSATPEAAVAAKAISVPKAAAAPKPVVVMKAAATPKTALAPRAAAVAAAIRAPTPVTKPAVEVTNDWQPIASAPLDRNVQVGVTSRKGILAIFFPCRRTEAGWINAVVKAPLLHEPACWREWREDYFEGS